MAYIVVGLALTAVGLSLKLMTMKSALAKAELLLKQERKKTELVSTKYEDLTERADARVKELKGRIDELLEESLENSEPGDLRNSLNGMLSDSED